MVFCCARFGEQSLEAKLHSERVCLSIRLDCIIFFLKQNCSEELFSESSGDLLISALTEKSLADVKI